MAFIRPFAEIIDAIVKVRKHYDTLPPLDSNGVSTTAVRDALVAALASAAYAVATNDARPEMAWETIARAQGAAQDAHADRVMAPYEGHVDDPQWHVSSALYWVLNADDDWLERKRHWLQ